MANLPTLAYRAITSKLTVEEVKCATLETLEKETWRGRSVLFCACSRCSPEIVEAVLDKGVDIDKIDKSDDWSALMIAANQNRWDNLQLLLRRGANVEVLNDRNQNVLHMAAASGAPNDIIKILTDIIADPQAKDEDGQSPADWARINDHLATAAFIEQYVNGSTKSANLMM
jgi:ankyrin repeat protein